MRPNQIIYTKGKQILAVDDEPALLKMLTRLLEGHHEIITALGGQAALEALSKHDGRFDIIIIDLNMPELSTPDFYHIVAEKYPKLKNRMIFITGGAYTSSSNRFLASVPNSFLMKPFTQEDLLQAIEKCIQDEGDSHEKQRK